MVVLVYFFPWVVKVTEFIFFFPSILDKDKWGISDEVD